jgi:hypothetical protein
VFHRRKRWMLSWGQTMTRIYVKKWQVCVAVAVLLLCAASLLFTSRKESRWHVSLDLKNWRIYTSEDLVFTDGGLRALTSCTHHLGPISVNTQRGWSKEQAHPEIGLKWEKMNRE